MCAILQAPPPQCLQSRAGFAAPGPSDSIIFEEGLNQKRSLSVGEHGTLDIINITHNTLLHIRQTLILSAEKSLRWRIESIGNVDDTLMVDCCSRLKASAATSRILSAAPPIKSVSMPTNSMYLDVSNKTQHDYNIGNHNCPKYFDSTC